MLTSFSLSFLHSLTFTNCHALGAEGGREFSHDTQSHTYWVSLSLTKGIGSPAPSNWTCHYRIIVKKRAVKFDCPCSHPPGPHGRYTRSCS